MDRVKLPEKAFVVELDDTGVRCLRPDGTSEEVAWGELSRVEVLTNDLGPFAEDAYFVLHGRGRGCVIPNGATNVEALVHRLQELPMFDNEALIEAMTCVDNRVFVLWDETRTKTESTGE
jgi:hypothetical protein